MKRDTYRGSNNPFFGKKHSRETLKKMSLAKLGKKLTNEHKNKIGLASIGHAGPRGYKHTKEAIEKIRFASKKMWATIDKDKIGRALSLGQGGTGIPYQFANYPKEFDKKLKEEIRKRDNYECQGLNCKMTEEEHLSVYGRPLEVHHIDYNRNNNCVDNLKTLCKQCNIRANYNRTFWRKFFCS